MQAKQSQKKGLESGGLADEVAATSERRLKNWVWVDEGKDLSERDFGRRGGVGGWRE